MNPAIEWLLGIVASLSGRQASHPCTFVLYAAASPAITSIILWPPAFNHPIMAPNLPILLRNEWYD